jgi:dCMP deaminase
MRIRPEWDTYFMRIAAVVAERSSCLRRAVGAILVRDKRLLSTGYNGAPAGIRHCGEDGVLCERDVLGIPSGERHEICRGLHAEQNAIIQAAVHGVSVEGSTLYSTHHPCVLCAKMLINACIHRIVLIHDYPDELSKRMLSEAQIPISVVVM